MNSDSPLRLLVKSYANGLLDREQYLKIRHQLLYKLSEKGHITQKDLQSMMKNFQNSEKDSIWNSYSLSDWIIMILGLIAAATLATIFYK